MKYISGIGTRIKEARERASLSVGALAREVGCPEAMLQSLEANRYEEAISMFPILERLAVRFGVSLDALMFVDTTLFDVALNQLRMDAIAIIYQRKLTDSLAEVLAVLEMVEHEFDMSYTLGAEALHYRGRDTGRRIDEDRVRDLLREVRRKKAQSE